MKIWSPDFQNGQLIPERYACDGDNLAPALNWSGVPEQTQSLALVMDDPDAPSGTYVHWIVSRIPANATGLPEGGRVPERAQLVPNSSGQAEYSGPCPPSGTHRYFFKLYALDVPEVPNLSRENYSNELMKHALASAEYIGYVRAPVK